MTDPPPSLTMDVWFPLNNPIKPCSVLDKICSYTATTNIRITEIIPFTEKTNVKNRTTTLSKTTTLGKPSLEQQLGNATYTISFTFRT